MKDFPKRTLTALIFGVVMIGGVLWNQISFMILTSLMCAGCLWEYFGMIGSVQTYPAEKKYGYRIFYTLTGFLFFVILMFSANQIIDNLFLYLLILILSLIFLTEIFSGGKRNFQNSALNITGIIYIALPLGLLHNITGLFERNQDWHQGQIILGMLLLVWTNDTMAYIIGSQTGKHKMAPAISPKKSWEGFFGGMIFSIAAGYILSVFVQLLTVTDWIIIALIMSVIGTVGDLFESMLKRNLNLKDSGNLLPGHGGLLDRFDAFIFSIPFVFVYIKLFA